MLENLSLINFLIYAMGFGFAAAMIYTNIQRTALSKFINALIDKECTSCDKAQTLKELGLSGLYASIAKSASKKQFGIKKSVCVIEPETKQADKLEALLDSNGDEIKFYLKEDYDKELLLKRYNYETLSAKYIALFLAALIAIVIAAVFAVNLIITNASRQPADNTDVPEKEISEEIEGSQESEAEVTEDAIDSEEETIDENDSVATPTLPVSA